MMEGLLKTLVDVSYNVSDWQRAKKFYTETLGLPVIGFISDEVGWMELGEEGATHLALSQWRGPGPVPTGDSGGIGIFSVEDSYAAVSELRGRGVRCEDVISVPGMVTYASFYDPDGNRLQIAGPPPKG